MASSTTIPPSTSGDSETTARSKRNADNKVEVGVFKEFARNALIESLNAVPGAKTLVLDPSLAGPLGLVTEVTLLKHQAVDKMYWLESGPLQALATKNVVYLCRPRIKYMKIIAEQIKHHQSNISDNPLGPHTYTILLTPRVTELCRRVLQEEGVAGDVTLSEYKLEFIPLEDDLLSLELENVNRDIFLNGDDTPTYYASMALMTFQRIYGLFPRILSKGSAATKLRNLLSLHRHSDPSLYSQLELSDQLDGLIILDRAVDWITPMLTQLTYEGLLDEFVGLKNSQIEVDPNLLTTQTSSNQQSTSTPPSGTSTLPLPPKKKKHLLSSNTDKLYAELRDLNFAVVGSRLSRTAKRLESDYEERKRLKSVKEMKEFVGKLGGLQNEHVGLRLHTGLSEILMPVTHSDEFNKTLEIQQNLLAGYDTSSQLTSIEDLMNQEIPYPTILRAIVLLSLTSGGIRPKFLESFKRDFLQVYGYHHLALFISLEQLGLLVKYPAPPGSLQNWSAIRKGFKLIVDEVNERKPTDISYTYSGYAPLSCRLVQSVAQRHALSTSTEKKSGLTSRSDTASQAAEGIQDADMDGVDKKERVRAHPIAGWGDWQGFADNLPGPAAEDERQEPEGGNGQGSNRNYQDNTKTTMVFFLGGCTYTEIAALRFMSQQTKGRRFLIATTGIINGSSLLKEFAQPDPVMLKSTPGTE